MKLAFALTALAALLPASLGLPASLRGSSWSSSSSSSTLSVSIEHADDGSGRDESIEDAVENGQRAVRNLSAEHKNFKPLSCNAALETSTTCDGTLSTLLGSASSSTVVVPCGSCYVVDVGPTLDLPHGLNIEGKLVFQDGHKVTVTTPFVYVQGILEIVNGAIVTPENQSVKFVLTGTTARSLTPHTDNAMACSDSGGSCPVGKKPFVVAGGRLDVRALPPQCPAWTTLHDVLTDSWAVPSSDWMEPTPTPEGCNRAIFDENFAAGEPDGWRGNLGATYDIVSDENGTCLKVTDRTRYWQGPYLDMLGMRDCLVPDVDYLFSAKVRLTKPGGGSSLCSTEGTNCLRLVTRTKDVNDHDKGYEKHKMKDSQAVPDGTWFDFTAKFQFNSIETDPLSAFETIMIDGPEEGVDMEITDILLTLPPEDAYGADPANMCQDLFPGMGPHPDAGRHPFPLRTSRDPHTPLVYKEEILPDNTINTYLSIVGRWDDWASLTWDMNPECFVRDAVYKFTGKFRIQSENVVTDAYMELRSWRDDGGENSRVRIASCPPMGGPDADVWVECTGGIILNEDHHTATKFEWWLRTGSERYGDVDYDDISFEFVHGATTGLVVDRGVETCWGTGSEVLVTSHTFQWDEQQVAVISSVADAPNHGDGSDYAIVSLENSITRPTTELDNQDFAVEVALLSRNVKIEGANDDTNALHGGHLMVLHTPAVHQLLEGVEFRNMGQQGELGRYPIHFHMCGSVKGAKVSKNLVRDSNQRCFVIHGTHNTTIEANVAYDTSGHCFLLEDGAERDNEFLNNLGAKIKQVQTRISSDESDNKPSAFWITNPDNIFRGNVAAGAHGQGFWLELRNNVRGPSRDLDGNDFNPKYVDLGLFSDNCAHSNSDVGLRTYPHGYVPPNEAVFYNTRSFRNKNDGVFFHNSRNLAVEGGVFADNRQQIDIDRADNVRVTNAAVVGVSDTVRGLLETQKPWHLCPHSSNPIIGIQFHYFNNDKRYWAPGGNMTGVSFSGFDNTGCTGSHAINFDRELRLQHFDYFTQFKSSVVMDDSPLLDACTAEDLGVDDVHFTDLNSRLSPLGTDTTLSSSLVSNKPWMTTFIEDKCTEFPDDCYSYCEDTCLRTVTFNVDLYETTNILHLYNDPEHDTMIDVVGKFRHDWRWSNGELVPNVWEITKYWRTGSFSVTLPSGSYRAFFKDAVTGMQVRPKFIETIYEPAPECDGHVNQGQITIDFPPVTDEQCQELLKNNGGELEGGNYTHWLHTDGGVDVEAGVGLDGSYAIVSTNRDHFYRGLGQYIEMNCLKHLVGKELEITAYVHLENDNGAFGSDPYECDPNGYDWGNNDQCPRGTILFTRKDPVTMQDIKHEEHYIGQVIGPYNKDGYNLIHHVFKVTDKMVEFDKAFLYFSRTKQYAKIFLDNVSLHPYTRPTECTELIENGGLKEETTKFWRPRDKSSIELATGEGGTGYALKTTRRDHIYWGPLQWLQTDCFTEGLQYEVTLKYKLDRAGDTQHIVCDPNESNGWVDAHCPEARIYSWTGSNHAWERIGEVVDPGTTTEWGVIHGIFTATHGMGNAEKMYFYVEKANAGVDITIDNVSIKPYVKDCTNLIGNGDAEHGDTRGWEKSGGGTISAIDGGYTGAYALKSSGRTSDWYGIEQSFDQTCLVDSVNKEFEVTAKVKLMQGGSVFICDPSEYRSSNSCPVATLKTKANQDFERDVGAVIGDPVDGWYTIDGLFQISPVDYEASEILLKFRYAPANVDIIIDDVTVTQVTHVV